MEIKSSELGVKEMSKMVKILGVHFTNNHSYKMNFETIEKSLTESLKGWNWRGLTLLRKYKLYRASFISVKKDFIKKINNLLFEGFGILGDPGATSWDDTISLGKSLLQELKSPSELILTELVPEVVEIRPADWAEKYFSAQSAMRSSGVTLSPSYTK